MLFKKKKKLKIYKKLEDLLLKIQKIKPKAKIKNIDGGFHHIKKYSNKYLLQESDLFFDWYLPLVMKKNKALKIKKNLKKKITNTL